MDSEDTADAVERLDNSDKELMNMPEGSEAFDSCITAARESINAARAILRNDN